MAQTEGQGPEKSIMITPAEKEKLLLGMALAASNCNDKDEIVPKPFRLSGFLPTNVPILLGMVVAPPTMFNTIMLHWVNQSYNAGLNYGNKNSSTNYTN